jgi:glycosyltransferase involved in cell wall biosynthesis
MSIEFQTDCSRPQMDDSVAAGETVELSVVMPCLNERETVGVCVRKALASLHEAGIRGEVIVGDNGSTDESVEIARSEGARVVHVEEKGYGSALRGWHTCRVRRIRGYGRFRR